MAPITLYNFSSHTCTFTHYIIPVCVFHMYSNAKLKFKVKTENLYFTVSHNCTMVFLLPILSKLLKSVLSVAPQIQHISYDSLTSEGDSHVCSAYWDLLSITIIQ